MQFKLSQVYLDFVNNTIVIKKIYTKYIVQNV